MGLIGGVAHRDRERVAGESAPDCRNQKPDVSYRVPDVRQDLEDAHSGTAEIVETARGKRYRDVRQKEWRRHGAGNPQRAQQHVHRYPEGIYQAQSGRAIPARVPHPAGESVVNRHLHLVLVGGAGLDRAGLGDADLARRSARGEDIWLPHLGSPLPEREGVCVWVRRVIP